MAQITGSGGDGSKNIYWQNSVPCGVSGDGGGCKSPWLFLLAIAAAVLVGGKKGRR